MPAFPGKGRRLGGDSFGPNGRLRHTAMKHAEKKSSRRSSPLPEIMETGEGSQRMMYPRANLQRSRRMEKQSLPSLVAYSPRIRGKAGAKPVIVRVRIPPTEKTMDLQMSTKDTVEDLYLQVSLQAAGNVDSETD
ncbi:unnamed protein product, partial [Sphacelaria rigidula]